MLTNWRSWATWCCAGLLITLVIPTHAEEQGSFYGMLRSRDLTPFGFLRLDMRPAHAVNIETHTFAFEAELGYQNTWALSENVEKYLTSLEPSGRRAIGPAEIDAIRNLPGENYLFDLESATLDMAVHYKISSQWTAYLFVTAVSYQGGFLDSTFAPDRCRAGKLGKVGIELVPRLFPVSRPGTGQALRDAKPSSSHSARARSASATLESPAVSIAVALNSTIQARHLSAGRARE